MSATDSSSSSSSLMHEDQEPSPSLEKEYEDLKESLQCPICIEVFKKPVKILPCLHSFCSACLEAIIETSSSTKTTENTSSSSSNTTQTSVIVDITEDDDDVVEITEAKVTGTKRGRATKGKKKKAPPKKQARVETPLIYHPCPVCRQKFHLPAVPENEVIQSLLDRLESLSSFLESDTSDPALPPLPPSSFPTISIKSQKERDKTSILIDIVESRQAELDTSLSLIDLMETKIQETTMSEKDELSKALDDLTKQFLDQLEEQKKAFFEDLSRRSSRKLEVLALQRKQLEANKECLENSVKVSRSILKNASDQQLTTHLPLITDQFSRLKEDKSFLQHPKIASMFSFASTSFDLKSIFSSFEIKDSFTPDLRQALLQLPPLLRPVNYTSITSPSIVVNLSAKEKAFHFPASVTMDKDHNFLVCNHGSNSISVFDENFKFIKSFGSRGYANGSFCNPICAVVDHSGRLIVCDSGNHRIQIFGPDFQHIKSFGARGKGAGEFSEPVSVAVDQDDNIFVCDPYNHRIQVFNSNGRFIKSLGSNLKGYSAKSFNPGSITIDKDNRIFVGNRRSTTIFIINEGSNVLEKFPRGSSSVSAPSLAVDQHRNVLVGGSGQVYVYDSQGNPIHEFGREGSKTPLRNPFYLLIDHRNRIIVCDGNANRLLVFEPGDPTDEHLDYENLVEIPKGRDVFVSDDDGDDIESSSESESSEFGTDDDRADEPDRYGWYDEEEDEDGEGWDE